MPGQRTILPLPQFKKPQVGLMHSQSEEQLPPRPPELLERVLGFLTEPSELDTVMDVTPMTPGVGTAIKGASKIGSTLRKILDAPQVQKEAKDFTAREGAKAADGLIVREAPLEDLTLPGDTSTWRGWLMDDRGGILDVGVNGHSGALVDGGLWKGSMEDSLLANNLVRIRRMGPSLNIEVAGRLSPAQKETLAMAFDTAEANNQTIVLELIDHARVRALNTPLPIQSAKGGGIFRTAAEAEHALNRFRFSRPK